MLTVAGCVQPDRSFDPKPEPNTLDDVRFLHYLANVPVVTVDEGTRAMLILVGKETQGMIYEERVAALEELEAVKAAWRLRPKQILDKGTLAYMLRAICELPPGVNEMFARPTGLGDRRYALRACVHAGLLPHGLPHDPVPGGELLSAVTRAEEHIARRGVEDL